MDKFKLKSEYLPTGDQPEAIEGLVRGIEEGKRMHTLLGVTESGDLEALRGVVSDAAIEFIKNK